MHELRTALGVGMVVCSPRRLLLLLAVPAIMLTACGGAPPATPTPLPPGPSDGGAFPSPPAPTPTARSTADEIFVGAGDIGNCQLEGARDTGELLDRIAGTVFTLGDNAYSDGSTKNFADCYEPFWGRHKYRTRPSPGNHDYVRPGASPYFSYFGDRAGESDSGYYRFALGAWDIYSLNSNVPAGEGSAQYGWLAAQLAENISKCTLAYWHHPVRSSGRHGDQRQMMPIWRLLSKSGADVVLSAHDHAYERFAPMDAALGFDSQGMRQFVAGTGGGLLYGFNRLKPLSEVSIESWGVLKLTLKAEGYRWDFIPVPGHGQSDSGEDNCH